MDYNAQNTYLKKKKFGLIINFFNTLIFLRLTYIFNIQPVIFLTHSHYKILQSNALSYFSNGEWALMNLWTKSFLETLFIDTKLYKHCAATFIKLFMPIVIVKYWIMKDT